MTGKLLATTIPQRVPQAEIGTVYNHIAPIYDLWSRLTESRATRRALQLLAINNGEVFLEVAVGTGNCFSRVLVKNSDGKNIGIDLSPGMLKRARKKAARSGQTNYQLSLGSALDIPAESESVDALLNCYMFDLLSVEEMQKALSEFRRVLKTDGRLVMINMAAARSSISRIYEWVYTLSPRLLGGCRAVRLNRLLEESGFVVEVEAFYQQMGFPSEVVMARKRR